MDEHLSKVEASATVADERGERFPNPSVVPKPSKGYVGISTQFLVTTIEEQGQVKNVRSKTIADSAGTESRPSAASFTRGLVLYQKAHLYCRRAFTIGLHSD